MEETLAAERLKRIWKTNKDRLGLTQEKLGERFRSKDGSPITQGAVGHYLNGATPLNSWACREFARLLQANVRDFAPINILEELRVLGDTDDSREYFKVHFYRPQFDGLVESVITLPLKWAESRDVQIDQVSAVECSDNEMEPRIRAGEIVLIRRDRTTIESGKLYAFDYGNQLKIRRAFRKSKGNILIMGDARASEPEILTTRDLDRYVVIGETTSALVDLD